MYCESSKSYALCWCSVFQAPENKKFLTGLGIAFLWRHKISRNSNRAIMTLLYNNHIEDKC